MSRLKKYSTAFSFFLLLFIQNTYGQYYNKLLNVNPNSPDSPTEIDSYNNEVFTGFQPFSPPNVDFIISKIDSTGNLIAQNYIYDFYVFINYSNNRIHCMNDTVFVHGVSSENPIIQIYNSDLDSLEQIHYDIESENYIEHYIPNYMLHNENYIYWVGSVYYAEEHPQNKVHGGLVIRLLRSTLEVDTIFTYPHEMSDIHFKRPRFDYLGNLTVGYERTDRYDNELGHHKGMLKFDDDFNILHQLEVPFRHQHSEIVAHYELENGNYLFTDKSDTLWISGYAALHCMTPEGTQVWRREEISLDNNVVYKPIKSYLPAQMNADGNFIFLSYYYDVLSPIEARLLCINPEGEVIWERYFEGPEDCDVNYGAMRYLVQDDTGNLTLIGSHKEIGGDLNHWLIRTDSYGCIEPDCQLTSTESEIKTPEKLYKLIQNPIAENLKLSLSPQLIGLKTEISLFNASGKTVHSERLTIQDEFYQISSSSLSNGMYFLEVKTENNVMQSGKVVVQH